jgi:hypothetical protein
VFTLVLGPEAELVAVAEGVELVDELELLAQPPELPVTLVGVLVLCVLGRTTTSICHCRVWYGCDQECCRYKNCNSTYQK